jgi:hypothetical protein
MPPFVLVYLNHMSDEECKIPAIKYYQLHGLDKDHPYPSSNDSGSGFEFGSLPVFAWWRDRVEKTYAKYQGYSDFRILLQCFLFSFAIPFLYFDLPLWIHWFAGGHFGGELLRSSEPIYAVIFAPLLETLIFFVPLLELVRLLSMPRWFSYPLIFFFFESLHDQRYFFEHPLMWMTGYMFIVAYEAGRTRSLLHAIVFCAIVHEVYNLSCYLLDPRLYPNPFEFRFAF